MCHTLRVAPACLVAASLAACFAGCAEILGGLEEGRPHDGGTRAPMDAGDEAEPICLPWLDGFDHRVSFEVTSGEAVTLPGYPLKLAFDTKTVMASKKMRLDGADLRATSSDGTTVVPHWVQSGLGGDATILWMKTDLAPGRNVVFLYYGNDAAEQRSSSRDTFLDGIIANAAFEDGTAPWIAVPPTNGGVPVLQMSGGAAVVELRRDGGAAPSALGWCQSVTFPEGRTYRLVLDATTLVLDTAELDVWIGGVGGTVVWTDRAGAAAQRGIDTGPIPAGSTMLCLGGTAQPLGSAQRFSARYENLRVRVYAPSDPIVGPAGPEERACPRSSATKR